MEVVFGFTSKTAKFAVPLTSGGASPTGATVLKRLGHALTVFALLCAIGAHWVLLQSVAWTTMLAENLRTRPISEAVERTFDGEHPCALCKRIAKGRQDEKKSEFPVQVKKFECSLMQTAFTFIPPAHFYEVPALDATLDSLAHIPPVPPPRGFLVSQV